MYIKNNKGPMINPWGTPWVTGAKSEEELLYCVK